MKVLVPSTTYSSPSRRAVVRMAATSEPPSGSVIARAPIFSPASVGRTNRSTRSGSPDAAMCGSAIPPVNSAAISPLDAPASNIASCTAIVSSRSPPSPPTDSGNETPSSPCLAAARCRDRGTSPASSQSWRYGATSRRTNSPAVSRSASRRCSQEHLGDVHVPRPRPLAEALGLRVEPRRGGHAPPSNPCTTTLTPPRLGSACTSTSRSRVSGSSSRTKSGVTVASSQATRRVVRRRPVVPHPQTQVGVAALVARPGVHERAERGREPVHVPAGRPPRSGRPRGARCG